MGMQDKHTDQDRSGDPGRNRGRGQSGHGTSGQGSSGQGKSGKRSGSGPDRSRGTSKERSSSPSSMSEDIRDMEDTEESMRDRMDQDYEL